MNTMFVMSDVRNRRRLLALFATMLLVLLVLAPHHASAVEGAGHGAMRAK